MKIAQNQHENVWLDNWERLPNHKVYWPDRFKRSCYGDIVVHADIYARRWAYDGDQFGWEYRRFTDCVCEFSDSRPDQLRHIYGWKRGTKRLVQQGWEPVLYLIPARVLPNGDAKPGTFAKTNGNRDWAEWAEANA